MADSKTYNKAVTDYNKAMEIVFTNIGYGGESRIAASHSAAQAAQAAALMARAAAEVE